MASHSSSGSVAASASAPSDTASSSNGNGNPGMPGFGSSSSLPFSFLVTFVAIFLFFLGCGLGSRRVTRTLRHNLGLEVTGLGVDSDRRVARTPRKRPLLWDAFPHEAQTSLSSPPGSTGDDDGVRVFSHPWDVLAPLSATYIRTSPPRPASAAAAAPPRAAGPQTATTSRWHLGGGGFVPSRGLMRAIPRLPPLPTPRARPTPSASAGSRTASVAPRRAAPEMRWRGRRVPDWIARPLMPESLEGPAGLGFDSDPRGEGLVSDETVEGEREVQALQVVVLVSLPSPERARASRIRSKALEAERRESGGSGRFRAEVEVSTGKTIGEYLLGTTRVPWQEGEIIGSK